jgi:two-component system OmpR family response regulator
MDGVRALHALRRLPTVADVPVVFLTARVQPQEVRSYRILGSVDVITKPFEPTTLVETVRTIWKRHHV